MIHVNFLLLLLFKFYGRGLIVLQAGGGILQNPAASNTGSNSRTRPGMLPSNILQKLQKKNVFLPQQQHI